MWARGWDADHGGLFYFTDLRGLLVQEYWHDMKFWWPHCEAIIATLLAWKLTNGTLSQRAKGNLFKGPFHLPRMLWFCAGELGASAAAA